MKKYLIFALLISQMAVYAQTEPFRITRFHPFSLTTGALSLSQENFNTNRNRSTVYGLGLRYVNKVSNANMYGTNNPIEQYNRWKGGFAWVERRFYVPAFQTGEAYGWTHARKTRLGVYFAPALRLDYNQNEYDKSIYMPVNDPKAALVNTAMTITDRGRVNYFGAFGSINVGFQFTVFQNLFVDLGVGGGIKLVKKSVVSELRTPLPSSNYYYSSGTDTGMVNDLVIKEGVRPNMTFALGLRL